MEENDPNFDVLQETEDLFNLAPPNPDLPNETDSAPPELTHEDEEFLLNHLDEGLDLAQQFADQLEGFKGKRNGENQGH